MVNEGAVQYGKHHRIWEMAPFIACYGDNSRVEVFLRGEWPSYNRQEQELQERVANFIEMLNWITSTCTGHLSGSHDVAMTYI